MAGIRAFLIGYLGDLRSAMDALDLAAIEKLISLAEEARAGDRRVFVLGNGGSAATSSHIAVDLGKGASLGRDRRFRVMSLADNVPWVTALGNDIGYESVFVEQLKNFAEKGDLVIAVSGSGNSPNVLRAVEYAKGIGCRTVGLTGFPGGKLREIADLPIVAKSSHMGRIEDLHLIIGHMLCYYFMEA
ncbi:MAG: SIS domain-containing protein [Planctomycetota bacterium]|nr:SIS domain-containing protein [Planctomycetota bacterium]